MNKHYCAVCRNVVDEEAWKVTVEEQQGRKEEVYLFHPSCADSVVSGWGTP
jgi:hypothetical protein